MIIRPSDALAHAAQAGRGKFQSISAMLRALANDELYGDKLAIPAGVGITAGVGGAYWSNVQRFGRVIRTQIFVDLTGLGSSTTDLDVIGVAGGPAHLGKITDAQNGVIFAGKMSCIEVPVTGVIDVDLYAATVGTAVFDDGIAALTETALVTAGGVWTRVPKLLSALPADGAYLYLTGGAAGVVGTYTAGKFLIELDGYIG